MLIKSPIRRIVTLPNFYAIDNAVAERFENMGASDIFHLLGKLKKKHAEKSMPFDIIRKLVFLLECKKDRSADLQILSPFPLTNTIERGVR